MKINIELIYHSGCKNLAETRKRIEKALNITGLPSEWKEWNTSDPDCPDYAKHLPSPSIFVNRKRIGDELPSEISGDSCRISLPEINEIVGAIDRNKSAKPGRSLLSGLSALFTVLLSIIPIGLCPACIPAYLGILSAFGLGFLTQEKYLLPFTITVLAIFLGTLISRAFQSRDYSALIVGTIGSVLIITGKYMMGSDIVNYIGVATIIIAAVWNSFLRKKDGTCSACNPKFKGGD